MLKLMYKTLIFFMQKKAYFKIILSVLFFFTLGITSSYFFNQNNVLAQEDQEECEKATIRIIARNDQGEFLPNINYELYETAFDADQNPKPGKRVSSGKTSPTLGYAEASFVPNQSDYSLKMWQTNKTVGAFWFSGDIFISCGEETETTQYLSGFNFILRGIDEELRKDEDIQLYTQKYDADGMPIKEKNNLVGRFNTGASGSVNVYVADDSSSMMGEDGGTYVFSSTGIDGTEFNLYDLVLSSGVTEELNYYFSEMHFYIEDDFGTPFPANTKIEIYKQIIDANGENALGQKVKDIFTNDRGQASIEYPEGIYAARIKDGSGEYVVFWDLEMVDQEKTEINLNVSGDWDLGEGACEAQSNLEVIARNFDGDYIPNISFELYEQISDIDQNLKEGKRVLSGKVNELGKGNTSLNPDPRKTYILKMYDKNPDVGAFWFYDDIKFVCGENKSITKDLSSITFVLRDADSNLKNNYSFSLYTQKFDIDGNPIREKKDLLSSSLSTGPEGALRIYVPGSANSSRDEIGQYIFSSQGENRAEYISYDLEVLDYEDLYFDYIFSEIIFILKDASGEIIPNMDIELYEQKIREGVANSIEKSIMRKRTDSEGTIRHEYPAGKYALRYKDDLGNYFTYWNIEIKDREKTIKELKRNLVRVSAKNKDDQSLPEGTSISVYSLTTDDEQNYYKNKRLKQFKIGTKGYVDISLVPDAYLFAFSQEREEYGTAIKTSHGTLHKIELVQADNTKVESNSIFKLSASGSGDDTSLGAKLKGHILLQVEARGEAWYVDTESKRRYYMKDGATAYQMMREFGLGISNDNLKKIPIGLNDRFEYMDYDGDNLPDKLEEAIGTDMYSRDSDGDGYLDGEEVEAGYNPLGPGEMVFDDNLTEKLKGKILLQVESRGEAWYINPKDGKRYYMPDGDSAYDIMRFLSLGITNENLSKIEEGVLNN